LMSAIIGLYEGSKSAIHEVDVEEGPDKR
jgi:hypothetical protein